MKNHSQVFGMLTRFYRKGELSSRKSGFLKASGQTERISALLSCSRRELLVFQYLISAMHGNRPFTYWAHVVGRNRY